MDEDEVAELYRSYGPAIFTLCRRLLRDPVAAEDATQETFVRVCRHLRTAPDGKEALRWIYRIATNYCLNELRDRKLRPVPYDALPEDGGAPPEGRLAERDAVRRVIAAAPRKVRAVAWLYHVAGMEQAEVAAVLALSRRTVVTRLGEFDRHVERFSRRIAA